MLKASLKAPLFTDGFRLSDLLYQSYPPHVWSRALRLAPEKSDREQPSVRLTMCERSPPGFPHTQIRIPGCPRVAEILLMSSPTDPESLWGCSRVIRCTPVFNQKNLNKSRTFSASATPSTLTRVGTNHCVWDTIIIYSETRSLLIITLNRVDTYHHHYVWDTIIIDDFFF